MRAQAFTKPKPFNILIRKANINQDILNKRSFFL